MNQPNYYERDFFVPISQIGKFISALNSFNDYGVVISFTIIYMPSVEVFKAAIRFKDGDDYVLFHNIIVSFLVGIKTEESI